MGVKLIIGDQGAGKSCLAVLIAIKYLDKGYNVYSNLFIEGCYQLSLLDLCVYDLGENAIVILDEGASHGLGSRGDSYKQSNKPNIIKFFTMQRHYLVKETIVVSPSFGDIIPVIRDNTADIICVQRPLINILFKAPVLKYKSIGRRIVIDEKTNGGNKGGASEPQMSYYWRSFSTKYKIMTPAFKMYDSWVKDPLEHKDFNLWGNPYVKKKLFTIPKLKLKFR